MNKSATRKKQYNDNTIETLSLRGAVVQSLKDDLLNKGTKDAKEQLFGVTLDEHYRQQKITGDLVEGEELILKNTTNKNQPETSEKVPSMDIAPGFDYRREVIEGSKKIRLEDTRLIQSKVNEILSEIQKLASAQKGLEIEFREVVVEQRIVSPGKYHLNFFEWILSVIRLARMKIEDSGAWLSAFQSKKAKRQYWAMFKKHGTTFGLSNERVVATQTG